MEKRIVTFPRYGKYTEVFKEFFESLDLEVKLPPKLTDRTVKLGAKNSPDFACFPYKVTLGHFIEALEQGANTILTFSGEPTCRFRHFYKTQAYTLKRLGYNNFELYGITVENLVPLVRRFMNKPKSYIEIYKKHLVPAWYKLKEIDKEKMKWSTDKSNIGIVGQPHVCWEERVNFGLEDKIEKLGARPVNTNTLTEFLKERADEKLDNSFLRKFIKFTDKEKWSYREEAKKYFNPPVGGYALASFYNLKWLLDKKIDGKGIDGIVHILPLCCTFETLIEDYVNGFCQEAAVPLLRITIDENNSEANLDTRIETFVKLIKRKTRK